jgi:hypothetical protein
MAYNHPDWIAAARQRALRPDWQRFVRPDAERWIRPDAYRFMPPDAPRYFGKDVVRYFWPHHPLEQAGCAAQTEAADSAASNADDADIAFDREVADARRTLLRLKAELAEVSAGLKLRRFFRDLAERRLSKAYNPDQPRVPAGNPDGGQWTSGGGGGGSPARVRLAGPLPTGDTPEIPEEQPPTTRARNGIAQRVARFLFRNGGGFGKLAAGAYWLYEEYPRILAYQDPPKALDELQEATSQPKYGYDIHHIVEQTPAEQDGFSRSQIDAPDNKVRIPTYRHWLINGWYSTPNKDFGGKSPRDYLRGKGWDERYRVGLDALIDFGVLKP